MSLFYTVFGPAQHPHWPRVAAQCGGWSAALALWFSGLWWLIAGDVSTVLARLPAIVIGAAIIPPALLMAAWAAHAESRPHREWSRLMLDE